MVDPFNPFEDMARRILDQHQKYIDDMTRPIFDAQRAVTESASARIAAMGWGLPSMSAAALGLDVSRQLREMAILSDEYSSLAKTIEQAQSIVQSEITRVFQGYSDRQNEQLNGLVSSAIAGVADRISAAHIYTPDYSAAFKAAAGIAVPNFETLIPPFLTDYLTGILNKPLADFDEEDMETVLTNVRELVASRISESGRSSVTLQFWAGILVTLLIFIIQTIQGNQATEALKEEIAKVRKEVADSRKEAITQITEKVLEIIKEAIPEAGNEIIYVVERPAILKVRPTNRSATICTLQVNQLVSISKNPGKWMYVQYYDFNEGVPKTGWVFKKYLKRIK